MSQFGPAIAKTLAAEGGYIFVPRTGEVANMGLTCAFLRSVGFLPPVPHGTPASDAEKAAIRAITPEAAGVLYLKHFWMPCRCGDIQDQDVAAKFFDLAVNTGSQQAATILQRAISCLRPGTVAVDGLIGVATVTAANQAQPAALMAAIRSEGAKVYREIAAKHPELTDRLDGWLHRLNS